MRLRYAAVLLLASVCAFGQDIKSSGRPVPMPHYEVTYPYDKPTPKPLKCEKWERLVTWPADCDVFHHVQGCTPVPIDYCVPIMHEVTEKEWQALMERLKKLEKDKADRVPSNCSEQPNGFIACY